jgi:hypothetical protein
VTGGPPIHLPHVFGEMVVFTRQFDTSLKSFHIKLMI